MTTTLKSLVVIALLFASASVATEPPRGAVQSNVYTFDGLGWTFTIPQHWRLRTKEEIARVRNLGLKALEETLKEEIPNVQTPLLYLQHEARTRSRFTSDAIAYDREDGSDVTKSHQEDFDAMLEFYKSLRMELSEERGTVTIDGIVFATQLVKLYSPDRQRVLLTGMNFVALINGTSFSLGYTVDNEEDRAAIHNAVMKSKFKR